MTDEEFDFDNYEDPEVAPGEDPEREDEEDPMVALSRRIQNEALPTDPEGEPMQAILTKWVLVAEWHDANGNVWLTRRYSTGTGSNLNAWDMKGMLHEALFGHSWGRNNSND